MTFQVGGIVRVMSRGTTLDPNGMGEGKVWNNVWVHDMDEAIGKTFVIDSIEPEGIGFDPDGYMFPASVLELAN